MDERTGDFSLNLRDNRDIKRAMEMQDGVRNIDIERGQEVRSKERRERIQRKDGQVLDFPEHLIDQTKHKGIRPVGRGGKSAALHFGFSEAAADYLRGPDGMYFVWDDGWCPTTLWYKGTAPQHDPDGNLWVLKGGEWVLESEVESGD